MSFLNELQMKKNKLKPTETIVTHSDGRKFLEKENELGGKIIIEQELKSYGFVVDTKPDIIPACILENRLYLGSQDTIDYKILKNYQISHILSVGIETPEFINSNEFNKIFIPCLDLPETNLNNILVESNKFIKNAFDSDSNSRVLVHCNAGVSRSSSVVIGYLMNELKYDFNRAYNLVKLKRECIQPNRGFIEQLKKLNV